ncbi:solute carrier family 25, member 39/40 [Sporothrix brasiliensis 5110]|uniref:Solute carrier family 25, member 39/40 n=1 Tax=Sporothrix brasiliensis 5110 TaxID=1398154 RepID=A0A0C2IN72_9PEZI|nr:solute carrier family 25, member 39/40 [Sporothrix brasiliensis 5110]KIH88430.1 solute carrier family 25, member 39/40 [Sporothrix brasiliensis 5110]
MRHTMPHDADGQDHDRLRLQQQAEGPETLPYTPPVMAEMKARATDPVDPPEITVLQRMLSATTGSLLTALLVTPLDVVRVRLQSQNVSRPRVDFAKLPANFQKIVGSSPTAVRPMDLGVTACCREVFFVNANSEVCLAGPKAAQAETAAAAAVPDCAVEQHQKKTINSTVDGLRKIARNEGISTLWRGLSPTLLMSIPANVIYFTGYEWLRFNPESPIHRATPDQYAPLVAGAFARVLAATAVGPIELFRTRLQAAQGQSAAGPLRDTFQGLRRMVQTHGIHSLWRGLTLTLWRDAPFSAMYWWGYETVRSQLTEARERRRGRDLLDLDGSRRVRERRRSQSRENHRATFLDSFAAGSLSGAAASIATMPFDVGKTRTQVFREAAQAGVPTAAVAEEQTMGRLLWHIFRTEGIAGLFKGWIPRTLKVAPACAIMISSYEVGKKVFRGMNERARERKMNGA